jgi:uncharacterized protein YjbI with pentapeptide repeats
MNRGPTASRKAPVALFDHADLRGADPRGADLGRASVWGAHVEGTDLHETISLVPEQLSVLRR